MPINKDVELKLNHQMNKELYSANLYLSMASYCFQQELNGFGEFFMRQAAEEHLHMEKQFRYLHDVGGVYMPEPIDAPQAVFASPLQLFQIALEHERKVTESIYELIDTALGNKDYASYNFMEWFIGEQVEEEALMSNILKKLQMIGDNSSALFFLNEELLSARPKTVPMPPARMPPKTNW